MDREGDDLCPANATSLAVASPARERLEAFCALVLDDPELSHDLQQPREPDRFVALVVETARRCGFSLAAEDIWAAMRDRSLAGFGAMRLTETQLPPKGWLPIRGAWQDGELYLQWACFGEQKLGEPFFEGSVMRALSEPFNRLFRPCTPIRRLEQWLDTHPPLAPDGFIFHMSRCGSTLASQMLAALDDTLVVSEASPIDTVVQANWARRNLTQDEHALWLRRVIGALGQARGGERRFFIKLDSWHTSALPLFRRAFPQVPWVFLYRDPVEVLVSQLAMPGTQMIPGMVNVHLPGIDVSLWPHKPEEYYACVLARICEPVLEAVSGGLLLNYRDLPSAVWEAVMPHFRVPCGEQDRAAMMEAARYDAKTPSFAFTADSEAKQRAATPAVRAAAERWLGGIYRRLEGPGGEPGARI
jgi:hypothetical protein